MFLVPRVILLRKNKCKICNKSGLISFVMRYMSIYIYLYIFPKKEKFLLGWILIHKYIKMQAVIYTKKLVKVTIARKIGIDK